MATDEKKIKVIQVGTLNPRNKYNPIPHRVYSPYGISPTIMTNGGGNHEPKILIRCKRK